MKNALLTTVAFLTLTAGTALAADVDYGPAPEEIDWGGLYIGAHAGYGWGNRDGCFTTDEECEEGDDFDYDQKGWLAGAQIGYNFMIAPSFLLGAEVDASLASIDGDLELEGLAEDKTGVGEYNWLASAKLRAGWAATDNFLLYATGGLALAGFDYEDQFGCEFTQSRDGWLAGGGAEVKISSRASIKAEYNFINLGDESQPCTAFGILPVHTEADADLHVVKFGFNYLLGGQ